LRLSAYYVINEEFIGTKKVGKGINGMNNRYLPEGGLISTLSNREYLSSLQGIERAMMQGKILEAYATLCDSDLALHVDLCGIRGIMVRDECVYSKSGEPIKDIAIITRVGKPICFKVLGIDYDKFGPIVYLSRRLAQMECYEYYLSELIMGDIIPARITHLESFGAFADIGCGIPSLLSIDSISVSRISHPKDRLCVGNSIHAIVKSTERSSGRIFITLRELLGTWLENASEFKTGSTVSGIIRSVESYGVFIELAPNLAGLAELRDSKFSSATVSEHIGCRAAVYIKSIIPERMKIKLVLIDCGDIRQENAPPLKYYTDISRVRHVDRWLYSPPTCGRIIESVFKTGR